MKKRLSLMTAVIIILQVILPMATVIWESGFTIKSIAATTYEATDSNGIVWKYEIENGKAVNVAPKNTNKLPKELIIPDALNGYSVKTLARGIFAECNEIEKVIIPDSITSIGDYSFAYCGQLKSVKLSNNLTNIGNGVFGGCGLTTIEIPKSVISIGDNAFRNCSLQSIEIPNSVTSIGKYAFSECSSLTNIEIPYGVTSIGEYTFYDCSSLESINVEEGNQKYTSENGVLFNKEKTEIIRYPEDKKETEYIIPDTVITINKLAFYRTKNLESIIIPKSITNIDDYIFNKCSSLVNIEIPDSVTEIGFYAFSGCSNLESINIEEENQKYTSENGVLFNKEKTEIIKYPQGKKETEYIIPATVTDIGEEAFINCSNLIEIEIPNSVERIGSYAFYRCTSLINIEIPDSVTSIGDYAFSFCNSLTNVEIPDGVTTIGRNAFSGCSSLITIEVPNSVASIGESAFYNCKNLTMYCPSNSYTEIYAENNQLKYKLDRNVDNVDGIIWEYTLENGKAVDVEPKSRDSLPIELIIPNALDGYLVTSIKDHAFSDCRGLTKIEIPNSVTSIGDHAFSDCRGLTKIEIPNSVTSIGEYAFYYCTSLTNIEIPYGVTSIGEYTFYDCSSLTNIEIPYGVTSIGDYAFNSCSSLTNIEIPNSVTSIGSYAFESCRNLTNIEIPDSVMSIGTAIFNDCSSLVNIEIPDSVTNIGTAAFNYCSSLENINVEEENLKYASENGVLFNKEKTEIIRYPGGKKDTEYTIPNNITSIGEYAFQGCNLTSIQIPNSVERIGRDAFYRCTSLINIEIPDSVTSIGDYAFYVCISLEKIAIPKGVTKIEASTFSGCTNLKSIEIAEGVTSIGSSAFNNCNTLTQIEIPDSVTSIGSYAFNSCDSLTKAIIPDSVESIGVAAFSGCRSLTKAIIPDSVTSIGINAFSGCDSLTIHCRSNSEAEKYAKDMYLKHVIDEEGPTINVKGNPEEWEKESITVTLTVEAEDISGLPAEAYSFDRGRTWQKENTITKTYDNNENVVIKVKDGLGNEATEEVQIKIDKEAPIIERVEGNEEEVEKGSVTLRVKARDDLSGVEAYSFDGGATWQEENTKTYTEETKGIIIKVRDAAGNETTYDEEININKIVKLDRIEITKPNKTSYVEGEDFDEAGMVVTAIYEDETKEVVTDYIVVDGEKLELGQTSITISYTSGDITKTTTQEIEVKEKLEEEPEEPKEDITPDEPEEETKEEVKPEKPEEEPEENKTPEKPKEEKEEVTPEPPKYNVEERPETNKGSKKEEEIRIPEGYKLYKKPHNVTNVEINQDKLEEEENLKNDNTIQIESNNNVFVENIEKEDIKSEEKENNTQQEDIKKEEIPNTGLDNWGIVVVMFIALIFIEVCLVKFTNSDMKE